MTEFQYATPPRFTCQKCRQECLSLLLEGGRYQCPQCVQLYRKRQAEIAEQYEQSCGKSIEGAT